MIDYPFYYDALEQQLDLLKFWHSYDSDAWIAQMVKMNIKNLKRSPSPLNLRIAQIHTLEQAEAYYVSSVISQLLQQSLDSLPNCRLIDLEVPPNPIWVYFEKPFRVSQPIESEPKIPYDVCGFTLHIIKLLPQQLKDLEGMGVEDLENKINKGKSIADLVFYTSALNSASLIPMSSFEWSLDEDLYKANLEIVPVFGYRDIQIGHPEFDAMEYLDRQILSMRKLVISFLSFIVQPVCMQVPNEPPRATRKRYMLALPRQSATPQIRIVTLRRKEYQVHGSHREVNWSCQWIVRTHWRNQYYRKTKSYRPKLIASYVKGPNDKPLRKPATSIFAVIR